jgi:DNA polymerase
VLEVIAAYWGIKAHEVKTAHIEQYLEDGIAALKAGVADLVFANVMGLCANALRGCIVAPPGRKLVVSDLSNIEGRVLAWLAGEDWKIQAFTDFDNGEGHDLYKLAYAKSFGIEPEAVDKQQRQVGKVQELAFGYEGGVGAWVTFALVYGIDLEALGELAYDTIPDSVMYEAQRFFDWTVEKKRPTFGLSRTAFAVCDSIKRMWRAAHPSVVTFWRELEDACLDAVLYKPGETIPCRQLKVRKDGAWLRIGLPSGRALCYPQPKVENSKLSYMGVNQYTRKWSRINTYGGKLVENATQAVARDVLAHNMPAIEQHGFDIVLSAHDELITEAENPELWNEERLSALMSTPPPWALDLPLAAKGFESDRYRKD